MPCAAHDSDEITQGRGDRRRNSGYAGRRRRLAWAYAFCLAARRGSAPLDAVRFANGGRGLEGIKTLGGRAGAPTSRRGHRPDRQGSRPARENRTEMKLRYGVLRLLARPTFDVPYAEQKLAEAICRSRRGPVSNGRAGRACCTMRTRRWAALESDRRGGRRRFALLIIQVTFTDATMTVSKSPAAPACRSRSGQSRNRASEAVCD